MSTVLTLLILAFLLWPVLQILIRAAQPAGEPETAQPERTPAGELPMHESEPPPGRAYRPLPGAETLPGDVAVQNTAKRAATLLPTAVRKPSVVVEIHPPIDPRQAIVFMTVIGPCRAASPYDSPAGS